VPQVAAHCPFEHTVPAAHGWPQSPQLALSVSVSTQAPPQMLSPLATHCSTHLPLAHTWVALHGMPQLPQLSGSLSVLAQYEPPATGMQVVSGAAQVVAHTPLEHMVPAAHGMLQPPQLSLSVCGLVHLDEQRFCPGVQV
jgi:hypothetical protein